MLYTLNLYSAVCLMYRNKTEKKKKKKQKQDSNKKKLKSGTR